MFDSDFAEFKSSDLRLKSRLVEPFLSTGLPVFALLLARSCTGRPPVGYSLRSSPFFGLIGTGLEKISGVLSETAGGIAGIERGFVLVSP